MRANDLRPGRKVVYRRSKHSKPIEAFVVAAGKKPGYTVLTGSTRYDGKTIWFPVEIRNHLIEEP